MNDLQINDVVRVKTTTPPATGYIVAISERLRHDKYLVRMPDGSERGFPIEALEKLPPRAWAPMLPPPIVPLRAIRGASGHLVCGTTNCLRILDPAVPTCPKCGAVWGMP